MSMADFLSRWILFEMVHLVVNLSTRTRLLFGKRMRFVDCAIFSRHGIHSYLFMRSYAIKGSPNQRLLLEDIYYAIESRVCGVSQ